MMKSPEVLVVVERPAFKPSIILTVALECVRRRHRHSTRERDDSRRWRRRRVVGAAEFLLLQADQEQWQRRTWQRQ